MPNNKTVAYISLGSNMGDSPAFLAKALQMLSAQFEILAVSPIYVTEPQGIKEQNWFHNQVLKLNCTGTAKQLLEALQSIEQELGRVRHIDQGLQFGPRCIDLDLLIFGIQKIDDPTCTVPHPRLCQRAFVLVPLHDIVGEDILPLKLKECLEQIEYTVQGEKIYQK